MIQNSNKLKHLFKIFYVLLSVSLFIPSFSIAASVKIDLSNNLKSFTLAPISESLVKKIEIRDKIINAYQNNSLISKTADKTYLMGFNQLDLDANSLQNEQIDNIDFSIFFTQKISSSDKIKLIAVDNYPVGLLLLSESGEKKDQFLFSGTSTDTGKKLDKVVTQIAIDNYLKLVDQQKMPKNTKYLVPISELEDNQEDVAIAGGKGASLGELEKAMAGISKKLGENLSGVQGCVLSVAALRHFFNSNPEMKEEIQRLVYGVDTQNATEREETANKIADMIRGRNSNFPVIIPKDLQDILEVYYHSLSMWMWIKGLGISSNDLMFDLAIAIRSSGTSEDAKVDVPWFKTSTGSEAGIGETSLGVRGINSTKEKTQRGWSSLLTDRAFSYRESQALISCAGEIGEDNYNYIIQKMKVREDEARKRGDIDYAERLHAGYSQLEKHSNMGYKRLVEFLDAEIAMVDDSNDEGINTKKTLQEILDSYKRSANEVMNLDKLGQALVILRQLDSNCSGTSFTCITNTGFTGSHLKFGWDKELGRVMALELDIANQQGEAVVSSLTNPDHYELVRVRKDNPSKDDPDPYEWIITSKTLGSKEVQVVLKDRLFTSEETKKNIKTAEDGLSGALDMILDSDNDTNKNLVLELTHSINLALSGLSAKILL